MTKLGSEITVTPAMIEAGVAELRERVFGDSLSDVVESVYLMMEIERRS